MMFLTLVKKIIKEAKHSTSHSKKTKAYIQKIAQCV